MRRQALNDEGAIWQPGSDTGTGRSRAPAAARPASGARQPGIEFGRVPLVAPNLAELPRERLASMLLAGEEILECYRVLAKGGLNVVGEVLRGQGEFVEYEHYPRDDVFDQETSSQCYYHAHGGVAAEHGHFHTFLRRPGMPAGVEPLPNHGVEPWPEGPDALAHLTGIAMDPYGFPMGLFAVNRWVVGDAWFGARDAVRMLDRFAIDHAFPSWPTNRWITSMLQLFRPHVEALLRHRDAVVEQWATRHPGVDVLEDRRLEVTGYLPVSVDETVAALRELLH